MSGWFALFRTDGAPINDEMLERTMRQLRARGPNGEAVVVEGGAALGLTALDTQETVPTAMEPVRRGPLVVTGHARIDAREDVGRALGVAPGELAAMSDLALLARALERWGEEVPARVFGEFAAAAWDADARRLTVVRDAFGVRPAYVAHVGGLAIASNTLDAVRVQPEVSERLDDEAILELLLFDWIVGPGRTPFIDVRLSPPGGSWVISPAGATSRVAWTLRAPEVDRKTPWREQGLRWRDALDVATADRVRGAPASIALSGGIDSTAIAASAARLGVDRLFAATDVLGTVLHGRDDEGDWASMAARHLGIRHQIFTIAAPPADEPFAWQTVTSAMPAIAPYNVEDTGSWRAMASHARIMLHGEGGDEIWRASEMTRLLGVEPWAALARGVVETVMVGHRPPLGLNIRGRLRGTRKRVRPPRWLSDEVARRFDLEALIDSGLARIKPVVRVPRSGSMKGLGTALWQGCVVDYDAAGASHGVELRLPLLDYRVVDAALRLPPLPGVVAKLAARKALRGRLPRALLGRKKTPAAATDDCRNMRPPWARLPAAPLLAYYVDVARLKEDAVASGATWEVLRALCLWRWLGGGARRPDER